MNQWVKITSEADLPAKPGEMSYEHVECLVYYLGDVRVLMWNCEERVWDDAHGDDYCCGALEPAAYLIIDREPLVACLQAEKCST